MASTAAGFDFIVIGAGSSGCTVAARLADSGASVLLLEAGDSAEQHPETLSANGFKDAFAKEPLLWHRMTTSQKHCGNRHLFAGTGRVAGGSGAVNGMVYTRGDKRDYNNWPTGWQWHDLLPAFEQLENTLGIQPRPATSFAQKFIDASVEAGFLRKDGLNDGNLSGYVGCNDINYRDDERRSTYRAYIHDQPLQKLKFITGALVERIVFNKQKKAIAVEYRVGSELMRASINKEVILCAGALETPKLLMLSGVGPARHLSQLNLDVVLDAPAVGQHLQDHPNVCLFYRAREEIDFLYPQVYGFDKASRKPGEGHDQAPDSCYVCYAAPASIKESMLRMLPILALPGRLYRIRALRRLIRGMIHLGFSLPPVRRFVSKVFGIVVILGKPTSKGSVQLASTEPADPALIDPAYYASMEDRQIMEAAIEKARLIARQPALARAGSRPLSAGARNISGSKLWKWVHAASMTTFHFCGSCRMGDDDESPVDTQLRVKGLANVRVADASVMPEIPVSALNAPSMMIGYRAAEFILKHSIIEDAA